MTKGKDCAAYLSSLFGSDYFSTNTIFSLIGSRWMRSLSRSALLLALISISSAKDSLCVAAKRAAPLMPRRVK